MILDNQKQKEEQDTKKQNNNQQKCTICNKPDLIKLPAEFQIYARKKHYESFFCFSCVQIINFVQEDP